MASLVGRVIEVSDRVVRFTVGEDGFIQHLEESSKEPHDFTLKLHYLSDVEIAKLHADATIRRVGRARNKVKREIPDAEKLAISLAEATVKSWDIKAGGLKNIRQLDLKGLKPDEPIDFSPDNVKAICQASIAFGDAISLCMADTDFWFPGQKEEEGNSASGPGTNTPGSAATPASRTT